MGGGLVGFSIAYGLARCGLGCALLDLALRLHAEIRTVIKVFFVAHTGHLLASLKNIYLFALAARWLHRHAKLSGLFLRVLCDAIRHLNGHGYTVRRNLNQRFVEARDKCDCWQI